MSPFTTRENEILAVMAAGHSCRTIGKKLGISEFTVRKHRSNMLAKVGSRNASELVGLARDRGWLKCSPGSQTTGLSARERSVMALVVDGLSSKEIARILTISAFTVRKHRENLMRKLRLHSTAELVALAPVLADDLR